MKRHSIPLYSSLILLIAQTATAATVSPVSPGAREQELSIGAPCPTFSWSRDEAALDYQLAIFLEEADDGDTPGESEAIAPLSYAERLAQSEPAIRQDISGPALSWTPAAGNSLAPGRYAWYVQGIDQSGQG